MSSPPPPTADEILAAFRACRPLPLDRAERLLPNVTKAAQMVADTLLVGWEWGLAALMTLASVLIPQDRFSILHLMEAFGCHFYPLVFGSTGVSIKRNRYSRLYK